MNLPVASASSIIGVLRREMKESSVGTWTMVGWDGRQLGAGKRVRISLPHLQVHVVPTMSDDDITLAIAGAIAQLRVPIRGELARRAKDKEAGKSRPKRGHVWDRIARLSKGQ